MEETNNMHWWTDSQYLSQCAGCVFATVVGDIICERCNIGVLSNKPLLGRCACCVCPSVCLEAIKYTQEDHHGRCVVHYDYVFKCSWPEMCVSFGLRCLCGFKSLSHALLPMSVYGKEKRSFCLNEEGKKLLMWWRPLSAETELIGSRVDWMVPLQSNIYLALSMSWGSQHWLQFWPARGFLFLHWQIFIVLWQGSIRKQMVICVSHKPIYLYQKSMI